MLTSVGGTTHKNRIAKLENGRSPQNNILLYSLASLALLASLFAVFKNK